MVSGLVARSKALSCSPVSLLSGFVLARTLLNTISVLTVLLSPRSVVPAKYKGNLAKWRGGGGEGGGSEKSGEKGYPAMPCTFLHRLCSAAMQFVLKLPQFDLPH